MVRWCRIGVLLLLLALVLALLYAHHVGLPGFLKTALQTEFQRRGLDLQFQRLAWHWYRGFVVEGVTLRAASGTPGPRAHALEVALNLDWDRLLRESRVELESLRILGGRLVVPVHEPGALPDECSLEDIGGAIRFLPGGTWVFEEVEATFLGSTLHSSGTITNAPAWVAVPRAVRTEEGRTAPAAWRAPLRDVVGTWRRLQFAEPPEVRLRFHGDARQPASFVVSLRGQARGATTPWFSARNLRWLVELNPPPAPDGCASVVARFDADRARTAWGSLRQASFLARAGCSSTNPMPSQVEWELVIQEAQTAPVTLSSARLTGHSARLPGNEGAWRTGLSLEAGEVKTAWGHAHTNRGSTIIDHSLTGLLSTRLDLAAEFEALDTRWSKADFLRINTRLERVTNRLEGLDAGEGFWTRLAPLHAAWQIAATNLESPQVALTEIRLGGDWTAPRLVLTNLHARLYGGSLDLATARLDVATRELEARFSSAFDAHAVAPLLGEGVAAWLNQFQWSRPPELNATVRAVLPSWTLREPAWGTRLLPSVVVEAKVQGQDATYREVRVQEASLAVTLSNQILRLRDFHVVRPEGDADLSYDLDTVTQDFRWRLRANLDPRGVGPAVDSNAPRLLSSFQFNGPAAVTGEVWGRWGPAKELNLALDGILTNFTFRGEAVDELRATVQMTNQFLVATNASLRAGPEWARAAGLGVDFVNSWVYVTNADAELEPLRFARVIGSNLVTTLSPYRFDRPPRVQVDGRVPIRGRVDEADLRLTVAGGPFHYWRFHVPHVTALVHWEGDRVSITNAVCGFYGGELRGHLRANLLDDGSAELAFRTAVTNINLQPLVADTIRTTNRIEGTLQGLLDVTRANSADWKSWKGSGRFLMRDGLLWDLPVFSILSPMLNALVPGLGNSRARAATGSFTITNSVMRTDDLEIAANLARLAYRGTLDFDWNVRAQVEAEIMPGTPVIGPILNILIAPVAKALIFKIHGTLGAPEVEPLLVPKFLLPMVRPFQTLRGLFEKERGPGTHPARSEN